MYLMNIYMEDQRSEVNESFSLDKFTAEMREVLQNDYHPQTSKQEM